MYRLFVEKLPKHSGYNKAPVTDRSRIKKLLKPAFERAMDLKERLKIRYEEEKKMFLKQQRQQEIEQKTIEVTIFEMTYMYTSLVAKLNFFLSLVT